MLRLINVEDFKKQLLRKDIRRSLVDGRMSDTTIIATMEQTPTAFDIYGVIDQLEEKIIQCERDIQSLNTIKNKHELLKYDGKLQAYKESLDIIQKSFYNE